MKKIFIATGILGLVLATGAHAEENMMQGQREFRTPPKGDHMMNYGMMNKRNEMASSTQMKIIEDYNGGQKIGQNETVKSDNQKNTGQVGNGEVRKMIDPVIYVTLMMVKEQEASGKTIDEIIMSKSINPTTVEAFLKKNMTDKMKKMGKDGMDSLKQNIKETASSTFKEPAKRGFFDSVRSGFRSIFNKQDKTQEQDQGQSEETNQNQQ